MIYYFSFFYRLFENYSTTQVSFCCQVSIWEKKINCDAKDHSVNSNIFLTCRIDTNVFCASVLTEVSQSIYPSINPCSLSIILFMESLRTYFEQTTWAGPQNDQTQLCGYTSVYLKFTFVHGIKVHVWHTKMFEKGMLGTSKSISMTIVNLNLISCNRTICIVVNRNNDCGRTLAKGKTNEVCVTYCLPGCKLHL